MPYGWGTTSVFTTSDPGGGRPYTRFRGPLILGATNDLVTASAGASVQPPHIANVSTQRADVIAAHAGQFFASSTATVVNGLIYLTQSTYSMTSSGGTGDGPAPTPGILKGAALMWDSAQAKLCVYSTVQGGWLGVTLTSS